MMVHRDEEDENLTLRLHHEDFLMHKIVVDTATQLKMIML